MTPEERALLGLAPGETLPSGGQVILATYNEQAGSQTAGAHTYRLNPIFHARWGVTLLAGSFNLWAPDQVVWESPLAVNGNEFCPIILEEKAVGVVFRGNTVEPRFLEVLSPVMLCDRLGVTQAGTPVHVRLLSGNYLARM